MKITKKTRLLAAEPKGPLLTGVHTEGLPVGQIKAGEPLILTGVGLDAFSYGAGDTAHSCFRNMIGDEIIHPLQTLELKLDGTLQERVPEAGSPESGTPVTVKVSIGGQISSAVAIMQ